jgi:catechol 2,3-dioxygenase-like lactoylglutathione lyase family enzyme
MTIKLFHNFFCQDIDAQLAFYTQLLDLPEAGHAHSPIYRAVETPHFQFGFHAHAAYELLMIGDRIPAVGTRGCVSGYPTFMLDSPEAVSEGVQRAAELGAKVIKDPYPTYYGEWQAVLADPEDHVFRLSCATLPHGVARATLQLNPAAA